MHARLHTTKKMKLLRKKAALSISLCLAVSQMHPALATLGGDISSIGTDQAQMKVMRAGVQRMAATGNYTVHESTLPSGTLVKQYVSNAGMVFAVSWSGPYMPDLKQLLGIHFDSMVARQAQQLNAGHRTFNQYEADLVIESSGHPRNFVGRAYLKSLIPANVTLDEIK